MKKILLFGIVVMVFLCSCRKPVKYSDIPEIKLISFEDINGAEGLLVFYFQDGDGDIGFGATENPPDFNFFCDYYEKQHGIFVKIDTVETPNGKEPLNFNGHLPRLSNLPEESINGEIYYTISPCYYDKTSPYNDTLQLQFYIVDRKLNKSNVEVVNLIRSNL
jgi:hypothetical protein